MRLSSTVIALAALACNSFFTVASPVDNAGGSGAFQDLKQPESRSLTGCLGIAPLTPLPARFKLFVQEDCVRDAAKPRCQSTPVPSYPLTYLVGRDAYQTITFPLLNVNIPPKPADPSPTFSVVDGRLVLHDDPVKGKFNPNIGYTFAHTPPDTANVVTKTGDFNGYDPARRQNERYSQFDVIALPNCAGVGLKQRDLASDTFVLTDVAVIKGRFIFQAVDQPVPVDQLKQDSRNAYLVVYNEDGTLYNPLI